MDTNHTPTLRLRANAVNLHKYGGLINALTGIRETDHTTMRELLASDTFEARAVRALICKVDPRSAALAKT